MINETTYFAVRTELLKEEQNRIVAIEQKHMDFLLDVVIGAANDIYKDFSQAMELQPFWINYPPIQRGRAPRGTSIPWGEVGEKTISACLIRAISLKAPYQIAGDGRFWRGGVVNSPVLVTGQKAQMSFQPELPPFYILEQRVLLCLTYFLKVVYAVQATGNQPLDYLELACVPNGLLLFDGPKYASTAGLLVPGKDEKDHPKKRTRVRLAPLATLAPWRSIKIIRTSAGWISVPRYTS